jgi:hypothetical protein
VIPELQRDVLAQIIFVDDGSTDNTLDIVRDYPVSVLECGGRGAGAARNIGWKAAQTDFIWFVDADCVAEEDALPRLMLHLEEPGVVGAGGSYSNLHPDSLLATLIHEEIRARHRAMPQEVNFLATFNVVYRREALEAVGGFDEGLLLAQDAELAFRLHKSGGRLSFDLHSRVGHHHPTSLLAYLKKQARTGYHRAALYRSHPDMSLGDSYSGALDHLQPALAMASLGLAPAFLLGPLRWLPMSALGALALCQVPMTTALMRERPSPRMLAFAGLGFIRAYARGLGFSKGLLDVLFANPVGKET